MNAATTAVFAYGSNLSTARIIRRIGPVRIVGRALLTCHVLRFHKRSIDGSTKADAFFTGLRTDRVYGVVYTLDAAAKALLDEFEGVGSHYSASELEVEMADGARRSACVYRARPERIDAAGKPYDWYHRHVLSGAREHGLPAEYIAEIAAITTAVDPDRARRRREIGDREPNGRRT